MKTPHEKTIDVLHKLIETCKDGQHGFQTAADDAKNAELRTLFSGYSAQRAEFVRELQQRARQLGDEGKEGSSAAGSLHRGWMNLKSALSSNEPHAVLAECERGEDAAVEAYEEALASLDLDPDTRELITRQFAAVRTAHDRVKQLRDSPVYQKQ